MKMSLMILAALAWPVLGADGKAAYDKACKSCHGANGEGNAKIAQMMKVTFKPLGSKEVQARPDAELKRVITKGEGKMKPVTTLSGGDLDAVVAHLRTLK